MQVVDGLVPVIDEGLGNSAYLLDLGDGRALAVDPSLDLRAVDRVAARRGLSVAFAAETHLHADFLSAARQLSVNHGARVLLLDSLGSYRLYFARPGELNRHGPLVARTPRLEPLTPAQVRRLLADGAVVLDVRPVADYASGHIPGLDASVVDVRQMGEYAGGHLPGAYLVELGDLSRDAGGPPDGPVTVMCGHGERAATGASLLERAGRHDPAILLGGPRGWAEATGPALVTGR